MSTPANTLPRLTFAALLSALKTAAQGSTAVQAWVTAQYGSGSKLAVQIGDDDTDPDALAVPPILALTPITRPLYQSAKTQPETTVAAAILVSGSTTSTAGTNGASITHNGIARAEELAELLEAAFRTTLTKCSIRCQELTLDETTAFPHCIGTFIVSAVPQAVDATTGLCTP